MQDGSIFDTNHVPAWDVLGGKFRIASTGLAWQKASHQWLDIDILNNFGCINDINLLKMKINKAIYQ